LEQVEAVADRIAILREGELETVGGVATLRERLGTNTTIELAVTDATDGLRDRLRMLDGVHDVTAKNGTVAVGCDGRGETKLSVLNAAADAGVYRDFTVREPSLDDVFSRYTEGR
jgi:ABC-2 type transport system ATP-binding protein